jgi:streptogramin lyase
MRKLIGLLVLVCACWAGSVNAATLVVSDGQLMGATGVDISGSLYDVAFVDGSCNALFDGCSNFAFTTDEQARIAAIALIGQVFIDTAQGQFDYDPSLTSGCDNRGGCLALIPYAVGNLFNWYDTPQAIARSANNNGEFDNDYVPGRWEYTPYYDTGTYGQHVYAVFTPSPLPLPDAPTIDSIEPGNAQATVSFTPGEDNGSPITGYRYIKDNGFVSSPDFATTGSTAYGIAMDGDGNVYTANRYSDNVSKITPDGIITTAGTTGAGPRGITLDVDGNIYTANLDANTVSKIALDGTSTVLGTTGLKPRGIAVDTAGNVYTSNTDSDTVSKITPAGASTIFGTTGNTPVAIAIDANGNLYTANVDSDTVSKITAGGISTILGVTGSGPRGITVDADGNVYTANQDSDDVSKIAPDGTTTTLATTGAGPRGIAIDAAGNIYTANRDADNVSKITPDGNSGILGAVALRPRGIAVDTDGNVFTSSTSSNTLSKITDTSTATFAATGDTSPITITGLTNDTEYLISLIAVNDVGESAASNAVAATPIPVVAPDAPQITDIEPGNAQITISVSVADDGGSPITGYTAACFGDSIFFGTSPTSPITVSGLTNGQAYVCLVTATNAIGNSPISAASASVTPVAPPPGC